MLVVIMGVSGSGKTTVAQALARACACDFHDADDFHPGTNIDKMRRGVPLDPVDRDPWLEALRAAIDDWLTLPRISVLACSALTREIRTRLGLDRDAIRLVHLHGDEAVLEARLRERRHFMPAELLPSQLALLERPEHALVLDARRPVDELVDEIRAAFGL